MYRKIPRELMETLIRILSLIWQSWSKTYLNIMKITKKYILNEKDDFIGYIYKITNLINGWPYIGQTTNSIEARLNGHIWASLHKNDKNVMLHNAIRKDGIENFKTELLGTYYSKEDLNEAEKYWIKEYHSYLHDPEYKIGYNMTPGGDGGSGGPHFARHKHSEETKAKMSIDRTGEKNANYGNTWKRTADMNYPDLHGTNNPMFGKHHSEEAKEQSRQKHLGKQALSNKVLDKVIMVTPEEGEAIIASDSNWFWGNIHRQK